jgi:lipopolysaccharide heptosyltransferase II
MMAQDTKSKSTDHKIPPAPSILIILMGSLGDVARGLYLVSPIKAKLPQSRITWLVEPKWAQLVRLHGQIDKVIIFKRAWRFSALWELYKELKQDHFDITLDLQRILKSGFFSLLSGAKRRIGFHRRNAKEFNWIFNNEHIDYNSDTLPKIRHYVKFTEYLGLPEPDTMDFSCCALKIKEPLPPVTAAIKSPYIAIVLGASWESKGWLFEGYLDLIRHILSNQELQVVLLGDGSQAELAKDLCESLNETGLINLVGKTSLVELTALLEAAVAGIGPDSGPGHLAAAVGTPFVSIFGPTSPKRTAPYGYEDLVVTAAVSCAPCYKKQCPERHRHCMYNIRVEAVMEKVSLALAMRDGH